MNNFSLLLDTLREERNISKKDLAERAHVTASYVSLLTRGGRNAPSEDTVNALASALDVDEETRQRLLVAAGHGSKPLSEQDDTPINKQIRSAKVDWGQAPNVRTFHGRESQLHKLQEWITKDHCQIILVSGIGGIGKTMIVTKLAESVQSDFKYIFWRSLLVPCDIETLLQECIQHFSQENPVNQLLPESVDELITTLINSLSEHRCLLVLDNIESLLEPKTIGQYMAQYEQYSILFKRLGTEIHQSCVLLTSREKPRDFARLEGNDSLVRSFLLPGIEQEGQEFLRKQGLTEQNESNMLQKLVDIYSGNPLALRLVSGFIQESFGGNVSAFLNAGEHIFTDIYELLHKQFERLSDLEQQIIYWLAIEHEPLSLDALEGNLFPYQQTLPLLEALNALRRRSMIETNTVASYYLQPIVLEYVTEEFIQRVKSEIETGEIRLFGSHTLIAAQTSDYIRQIQVDVILTPLIKQLKAMFNNDEIAQKLKSILDKLPDMRTHENVVVEYAAGNILNLLLQLQLDVRDFNFSHQIVRQAYLQGFSVPGINFSYANLKGSVFTDVFSSVFSVAFSPDNKQLLAAGTANGEVRVWDINGKLQFNLRGHNRRVRSLAFHPKSQRTMLASGSQDTTIRLWDVENGQSLRTLQGQSWVYSVAFNRDGTLLASGHDDHHIRIWDVEKGVLLHDIPGHQGRVRAVAFSPDGETLASGSEDKTICLWNVTTAYTLKTTQSCASWIYGIAFSPDGTLLASGHDDTTIGLFNAYTGQPLQTLRGHQGRIRSVAFNSTSSLLASGSDDQTVSIWNVQTGDPLELLRGQSSWIYSVAFSHDGNMLASGSDDQTIHLWHIPHDDSLASHSSHPGSMSKKIRLFKALQGYSNRIYSVAFNSTGSLLASGCEDHLVRLWDVETNEEVRLFGHENWVYSVAFNADDTYIVSGSDDKTLRVWDTSTHQCLPPLKGHYDRVRAVACHPHRKHIAASGSDDRSIRLWDIDKGLSTQVLEGHTHRVRAVAFSPDGNILASGSEDLSIILWNATTGEKLMTLQGHEDRVRAVAFSPNGKILASGSEDYTIRLWDVTTGSMLHVLKKHENWIHSVAFHPDGKTLASGSEDRTICLWHVSEGRLLQQLPERNNWVYSVAFAPKSPLLASGSYNGMIEFWHARTGEHLQTLESEKPYKDMNIFAVEGIDATQKAILKVLGASEEKGIV